MRFISLQARTPAPLDGLTELLPCTFPVLCMRGSRAAVDFYRWLLRRLKLHARRMTPRSRHRRRFRVILDGFPPWSHLRDLAAELERCNAQVVFATYARASGSFDLGLRHRPDDPLGSMAAVACGGFNNMPVQGKVNALREAQTRFQADAVVLHSAKSCRASSVGQAAARSALEAAGIPCAFIESDIADRRYWGAAQVRTRLEALFERLRADRRRS